MTSLCPLPRHLRPLAVYALPDGRSSVVQLSSCVCVVTAAVEVLQRPATLVVQGLVKAADAATRDAGDMGMRDNFGALLIWASKLGPTETVFGPPKPEEAEWAAFGVSEMKAIDHVQVDGHWFDRCRLREALQWWVERDMDADAGVSGAVFPMPLGGHALVITTTDLRVGGDMLIVAGTRQPEEER